MFEINKRGSDALVILGREREEKHGEVQAGSSRIETIEGFGLGVID